MLRVVTIALVYPTFATSLKFESFQRLFLSHLNICDGAFFAKIAESREIPISNTRDIIAIELDIK